MNLNNVTFIKSVLGEKVEIVQNYRSEGNWAIRSEYSRTQLTLILLNHVLDKGIKYGEITDIPKEIRQCPVGFAIDIVENKSIIW